MDQKRYFRQRFDCYESFDTMLEEIREFVNGLKEHTLSLSFKGGGFDDTGWCDWYGFCVSGWRYKTTQELELEDQQELDRIEAVEKQKQIVAENRLRSLMEDKARIMRKLAQAKAEYESFQEENDNGQL